jgi:hypothetical protein
MVLDLIHGNHVTKVRDLVAGLQKLDKFLTSEEIHEAVRRLESRGEINVSEEILNRPFFKSLADFEANAPFWTAIIASALALIAILALAQGRLLA